MEADFGQGPVVVGDVIDIALRVVAPSVVRAANRVTLYLLAILHDHGAGAGGQVRAHVSTVCVKQHGVAAFAAVERQILPEVAHGHRTVIQFLALGDDEPAARKCVGSQVVINRCCHGVFAVHVVVV